MGELPAGGPERRLGGLLRAARLRTVSREGRALTQRELGSRVHHPHQQISRFENDQELPQLSVLADLHAAVLDSTPAEAPVDDLADWLLAWLSDHVPPSAVGLRAGLSEALERLVVLAPASAPTRSSLPRPLANLADFPGPDPFTIILGDRRELRAQSAADCMIYSAAVTDSMYLALLGAKLANAEITTDKLLARMSISDLRERPELSRRNLLIIGSPAVNWGARMLNKGAVFPFRIDKDVLQGSEKMLADRRMQQAEFAAAFWKLAQAVRTGRGLPELGRHTLDDDELPYAAGARELLQAIFAGSSPKAMMNRFRALGILDPADQENHGTTPRSENDFSVVTMARNPFAEDDRYRAVICAGVHGSGTAAAVRALATDAERLFRTRPLGAVLEVRTDTDLAWPERIPMSRLTPQTQPYDSAAVLANVERALALGVEDRAAAFQLWDEESLRTCAAFVRSLVDR